MQQEVVRRRRRVITSVRIRTLAELFVEASAEQVVASVELAVAFVEQVVAFAEQVVASAEQVVASFVRPSSVHLAAS